MRLYRFIRENHHCYNRFCENIARVMVVRTIKFENINRLWVLDIICIHTNTKLKSLVFVVRICSRTSRENLCSCLVSSSGFHGCHDVSGYGGCEVDATEDVGRCNAGNDCDPDSGYCLGTVGASCAVMCITFIGSIKPSRISANVESIIVTNTIFCTLTNGDI